MNMAVIPAGLILFLFAVQETTEYQLSPPRIMTFNGNLVIMASNNRHIRIKTTGTGQLFYNDNNLMQLLVEARNATSILKRLKLDSQSINKFQSLMNGAGGILQRLGALESQVNSSASRRPAPATLTVVKSLQRKVNLLESQLRRLRIDLAANECASNPCLNGGTCEDKYKGFICRCPRNWEGRTCNVDVNECLALAGTDLGCQNGATCLNKPGTYECFCAQGWFGVHCTQQSQACTQQSSSALCGHGICQNTGGGQYSCLCDQGWTNNPIMCTKDVDECASNTALCSRNPPVRCVNVPGSFYCEACPQGYIGDGYQCSDIDECQENNGACSVNPFVQCFNTQGSRRCGACPAGYQGDGVTCNYVGICSFNNGGCHPLAQCITNTGISQTYRQCICPTGYAGNGEGANGCTVDTGITSVCRNNPCGPHGNCINIGGSDTYTCNCLPGYTGVHCNSLTDPCSISPCQNGGTCVQHDNVRYTCRCSESYTGQNCERRQLSCGGYLTSEEGILKFPEEESLLSYPHGMSCAWVIITNATKVINITFTRFDLEHSSGCQYDWLQVHDGNSPGDQLIGRYCGSTPPRNGTFISTHNQLYFWFRSDVNINKEGFEFTWNSIDPVCGKTIDPATFGTISSPGSPGKYPPNRDCAWLLHAPVGKRLQFHFFNLLIESHSTCDFDYLKFFSGANERDPVIQEFCNSSHPEPLISPGRTVLIHFHSDSEGSDGGFQIAYSTIEGFPGCGGIITTPSGSISSPNHPNNYIGRLDCEWKIQFPKRTRIRIDFSTFALEASSNCRFDFLEIRDGNSIDSPLIGRFCGTEIPASFLSNGNALFIYFHTDSSQHDAGFVMNYKTICGGIFSSPIGEMTSPLYPNLYPNSIECIYEIEQPLGQAINLEFQDFQVESFYYYSEKQKCSYDKIEIHDGHDESATLVGTYCGSNAPPPVISTSNYLWMKFTTDGSYRNRGFYANYTTFSIACGGILKQSEGTIHSPQYPEIYLPEQSCRWVLVAPQSKVIQLTFNSFHMEHHSNCNYDYVEVYDNTTTLSNYMGRFCGITKPPTLTSSGNIMTINFKSDSSRGYEGFNAQFKHLNASSICGGTYFSSMGRLQSPNYPNFYPHTLDCTWLINTQEGQLIRVNISVFQIEQSLNCRYDYLEIRNGGYSTSPLIGKFCGTDIPRLFSSHSNKMYFRFVSDSSRTGKGFLISWDGTTNGCGGTLTSPTGSFTSPNYPETYGHNAQCTYKITVSRGSRIQLVLIDLELEESDNCRFDYIEIRDGFLSSSKVLGKYCSSSHLRTITSSSNSLLVKFRSDSSQSARGFHINYFTVCDNDLRGFHGIVESPNFPSLYPNNMQCSWKIHAPRGNNISITFSHFELEGHKMFSNQEKYICDSDYLEIKEYFDQEVTGTLTQLGEALCGTDLPQTVQSQFNNVVIKFVTDSYIQMSGFRLEWIVQGCGGHLDRPFGEFSSPGYPYGYKDNMECEWIITVDLASSVELTFQNFSLEQSVVCGFDAISIYGGIDNTSYLIDRICHSQHGPLTYTSSGNNMFIHFVTDSSYRGRGFHATYRAVPSTCGGKFVAPTGSIHSKNYPNFYDENEDCIWLIEVAPTHRINLTFTNIDIPTSVNCSRGSIEVYDGNSTDNSNQMLTQLCGSLTNSTTIISSSNYLLIHFQSKGSKGKGFKADYRIICGARIETEDSGLISLGESIKGSSRLNCSWIIVGTRPEDRVTLTITHMDMMDGEECFSSSVVVRDGEDDLAPRIGQYCGTMHPPHITSQGNAIFVRVQSLYSSSLVRFKATFSVTWTACGGALTSEHGSFASPSFPGSYPLELECVWTIVTSPGNRAMITFSSFELGPSVPGGSCDEDYLEIRKENINGALLGLYCGNNVPLNLTAAHSFWVKFRSTKSGGGSGFLASYSLMHGNELEGESGQIASPMYPASYVQEGQFNWRVTVNMSYAIRITFKEFFIENFSSTCHDYLAVYDGYDNTAQELFKGCGGQLPDPLTSSSNVIYISFTIDPFKVGGYFFLEWLQLKLDNYDYQREVKNATGCDRIHVLDTILNTTSVNISNPGYPNMYSQAKCEWILETSQNNHISIFIRDMDLQDYSEHCYATSLQIFTRRTQSNNWDLQHMLCLSNSTNLGAIHGTNLMKVVFSSYYSYSAKRGFLATAFTECGGSIEATNGIIEISNKTLFTSQIYGRYNCEWNITVRAGRTVRIKFEHFDVPSGKGSMCSMRYLMLKNGGSKDSPLLGKGKYCGSTPEITETTSNKAYVYFTAPRNTAGFRLKFEEVSFSCGSNIMLTHEYNFTQINSPNYQNIPPPHIECIWIITAPAGESIYIDFEEHFSLSFNCEKEYLELRDGGTILSKSLAVLCGTSTPTSYTTSGNTLYIKYFTDIDDPNYGFKANVSIAKCGGVIRQSRGKLFSPGYPNGYDNNLHCEWRLVTMSYNILNITIKEVDLTRAFKCDRKDRITLSDQIMGNSTDIGTYCGTLSQWKPKYIQSLSNEVLITFDSESVPHKTGRGFVIEFQSEYDECQTKIYAPDGEISSPGYPSSPPPRKYCSWIITVPKGRRVTVDIIDFDLDPTLIWDFPSQALRAFNVDSSNAIAALTANNAVTKIESTSNIMRISFYSYSYTSHRGFKLRFSSDFPQVCGGDIQNSSGIIESPSEGLNLTSYYCNWKWQSDMIQASNGTTYVMELINVTTGFTTPHCRRPASKISFLAESQQIPLKVVCMNVSSPLAILSPYANTEIEAQQSSYHKLSFTLRYSVSSCGGIIQWPENNITSPNYPMSAQPEMHCAWAINFPDNQIVKVKFLDVQIQGSECDKHYFVIHNGPTVESPTIGKFCRLPDKEIKSQTNKLWIEYHSGPSPSGRGFKIELSPDVKGCGGIIHGKEQEITSPNYPKQYPNNAECEWEIRVQEGYHIVFNFIDRFQLENSDSCENDFVQIYDYAWNEWVPKGKVCGRNLPSTYKSTTNQMKVLFRTNDKTQGDGFKAMWTVGCGAIITNTSSGTIISPGYPDSYGPNLSCNYTIHMPGHFVEASFIDFVLEQGNQMCDYDNVTLFGRRNYWETDPIRFGIFCGYNMPSSIVSRDTLTVIFKSDSWAERKGFLMKFKINECGGVMKSPGLIISPSRTEFESDYDKINCTWQINAPTNMVVSIRFTSFSLANEYSCRYGSQSIVVYDNPYVDEEKSLGKFCSNLTSALPVLVSSNNYMTVTYMTYPFKPTANFSAFVLFSYGPAQGCGGTFEISTQRKEIKSLDINNDGQYESFLDCHWVLLGQDGHVLSLEIKSMNIATCENSTQTNRCTCDFIEIRDGAGPFSELLGIFCGNSIPEKIVTSSQNMWVRFVSDGTKNAAGFRAQVYSEESVCGPTKRDVTSTTQILTSPNYPNNYVANTRCSWILYLNESNSYGTINIRIEDLNIPGGGVLCSDASLMISDTKNSEFISEGLGKNMIYSGASQILYIYSKSSYPIAVSTFCATGHALDVYSGTKTVKVTFKASSVVGKGFKLSFATAGCSRNYTGVQGRIKINTNTYSCTMMIEATPNRTISLYVLSFYIGYSCKDNYLKVYDGSTTSAPLLANMCGAQTAMPVFSNSSTMLLELTRRSNIRSSVDIDFTYTTTDKGRGCGGTIYNTAGSFTSPLYPENIRVASNCRWEIVVPTSTKPYLHFEAFNIGTQSACKTDYLEIFDINENTGEETKRTKLCGGDTPAPIEGQTRKIAVVYSTSVNNGGTGWVISFIAKHPDTIIES